MPYQREIFSHFKSDNCLAPRIWKIHVKELLKHGKEEHGNDTVHCGRVRSKEKPHISLGNIKRRKIYSRWERCTEFLFLTSSILTQPSISCLILFRACVPRKQVTLQPLPPIQRDKEKRAKLLSVLWVIWGLWRESIIPLWRLTPGYDSPAQQRCRKARTQVTFECYL